MIPDVVERTVNLWQAAHAVSHMKEAGFAGPNLEMLNQLSGLSATAVRAQFAQHPTQNPASTWASAATDTIQHRDSSAKAQMMRVFSPICIEMQFHRLELPSPRLPHAFKVHTYSPVIIYAGRMVRETNFYSRLSHFSRLFAQPTYQLRRLGSLNHSRGHIMRQRNVFLAGIIIIAGLTCGSW
ncbi:unnamed protein product [Protopolystoma xenopodis]|uniref:Uncharacterized protein n=1 Tax=Protopolystoma xenopodis TaxID=117903 RepID=A0A448XH65_9PLAT|nr:unnamed protein product [Protopolystoma xenopodis]